MIKKFKATLTVEIDMIEDGWDRTIQENLRAGLYAMISEGDITGLTPCDLENYSISIEETGQ